MSIVKLANDRKIICRLNLKVSSEKKIKSLPSLDFLHAVLMFLPGLLGVVLVGLVGTGCEGLRKSKHMRHFA